MSFQAVYESKYISVLYRKASNTLHLHIINQYEKIPTFLDPIWENIGRSRGSNKGRSLDELIRCRNNNIIVHEAISVYVPYKLKNQSGISISWQCHLTKKL